ncbi:MAG: DegT/DnrJ/EryC1/StrS family aminotransferase, partial [Sphingomonadales bacterium]
GAMVRAGDCHHAVMEVFSFHPVKTIAMGEGGAITTNDAALDRQLRLYRNHGLVRDPAAFQNRDDAFSAGGQVNPWFYEMQALGYNYRVSDINCALGLSQLGKLDAFARRRRALAARYDDLIGRVGPLVRPVGRVPGCVPLWHLYAVLIDFEGAGVDRAGVMARLGEAGVGTQVHYYPVHRQPYYADRYGTQVLPGADRYYARTLSLPLFPAMADDDVDYVIDRLGDVLER